MTEFADLYARFAPDVYRFALYLSGRRDDAEDITSETFVRAWTAAGEIRMATVKGYLFTIARNLYLESRRRARRHVALDDYIRDPGPGPQARAEQAAELDAALRGLAALPETDRAALVMRAVHEMPYEEIARALGLSLAAVKVRIHRARRTLLERRDTAPENAAEPRSRPGGS